MLVSILFIIFIFLFLSIKIFSYPSKEIVVYNDTSEADITKPKFTINNKSQNISVTAKEGNFISENEILLEKDVIFQSKKFKLTSESVIFDKKKFDAYSSDKSKFLTKNASIISNGFNITENGNTIYFKGKTILIIK